MDSPDTVEEFEDSLLDAKIDTEDTLATIVRVFVDRRDAVEDAPAGEDRTNGLVVVFERASGNHMVRWYPLPATWEPQHDLVTLLSFLGIDPEDSEKDDLSDIEGKQVPVRYSREEGWILDWDIIGDASVPERIFR